MIWGLALIAGVFASLFPYKDAKGETASLVGRVFGPFLPYGPLTQNAIDDTALALSKQKVEQAEGRRTTAYYDTLGYLTVGVGHRVLPGDNIKLGQTISDERINEFFDNDILTAFNAAKLQALEAGKYTPEFIAALTSVNFQLGTGWTSKFKNTWADIKNGNIKNAVARLEQSDWKSQTPNRVAEFIETLKTTYGVA